MKKFIFIIISVLLAAPAFGQAQINTKKVKIEDFMEKPMKVVISGNMFFDQCLKEEISSRWRISPFEFCTLDEFNRLKTNDNYYFMILTEGRFRKEAEPGISYLSVLKGGSTAEKGLNKMLEVVSAPLMSVKNPNGRELIFLPAMLDIMQRHIALSMENDMAGYGGLSNYTMNLAECRKMTILFADEDLSDEITDSVIENLFKDNIKKVSVDNADMAMVDALPNTVVSFTVAPSNADTGSYCYKILFNARTHEMYYFRKHRISKRFGKGFLLEDVLRIVSAN